MSYLARELISTQVCSAALIVLPPGVLQKEKMFVKKMLSKVRKEMHAKSVFNSLAISGFHNLVPRVLSLP